MIEIDVTAREITVKGHANFAEPGKDIVCAAVSTLFQAFIRSVEQLTSCPIKAVIEPGNSRIELPGHLSSDAFVLLCSFRLGCRMITEAYPDNVKLTER